MKRERLVVVGVVTLLLVVWATPAAAYVDVGYDPEGDSTSDTDLYDIRSSVRSVERGPHGRFLRITTWTYDADFWVDNWVIVDAQLDARGGPAFDAVLRAWIMDMSGAGCELQTRSGRVLRRGTFRLVGEPSSDDRVAGVSCRVRLHPLHPTKEIRWRVSTIYGNEEPVFDVAPDAGMYD